MNATAEGEDEDDVMFIRAALHDAYIVIKNKTRVCVCVCVCVCLFLSLFLTLLPRYFGRYGSTQSRNNG